MKAMAVTCPHCVKRIKVTPKYFGKRVKCPNCEHPLQIPNSAPELVHAELIEPHPEALHENGACIDRSKHKKQTKSCCLTAILIPFVVILFSSILGQLISDPPPSPSRERSGLPPDLKVAIIEESTFYNYKRSVTIRLNRKVSKGVLRTLAYQIKSQDSNRYDRTFICYLLPGMELNAGAWATTHFNPNLKIKILGISIEDESD